MARRLHIHRVHKHHNRKVRSRHSRKAHSHTVHMLKVPKLRELHSLRKAIACACTSPFLPGFVQLNTRWINLFRLSIKRKMLLRGQSVPQYRQDAPGQSLGTFVTMFCHIEIQRIRTASELC